MEGSLIKLISYDNGFIMVSCWGVSPFSHDDDAARSVYAAINIQKRINRLAKSIGEVDFDLPIHIGISTGNLFMGIIGSDGSRKEVTLIGESIEKAFLFMQTAMKVYGKIYIDYQTKRDAQPFIDFQYVEHIEFANKYINHPVFEPFNDILMVHQNVKKCK